MVLFLVITLIPIIIFEIMTYNIYNNTILDNATEFSVGTINQTSNEIEVVLQDLQKVANMISHEQIVQSVLRDSEKSAANRYIDAANVNERLNFIMNYLTKDIKNIIIIGKNGDFFRSGYMYQSRGDYTEEDWFKAAMEHDEFEYIFGRDGLNWTGNLNDNLSITARIKDEYTGETLGVLLLSLRDKLMYEKVRDVSLGKSGHVFLLNKAGDIVVTSSAVEEENIKVSENLIKQHSLTEGEFFGDSTHMLFSREIASGLGICGVIEKKDLISDNTQVLGIAMIMMPIAGLLVMMVAFWFSSYILKPMNQLVHTMQDVTRGNLSVSVKNNRQDEIGQLCNSFNYMINRIQQLMDLVKEEQSRLRKAELKTLQAQINPHFLYNTLESVMALSCGNETVERLIAALSNFFRISLNKGDDYINVKKEVEHVENYLIVQKIRYDKKFDYEIHCPEYLAEYKMIKLTLQPIVENALLHGILNKRAFGKIVLSIEEKGADLVIRIMDTGKGISEKDVYEINTLLSDRGYFKSRMKGYGIYNVNERLHLFYKNNCSIRYESDYGEQTTVTIRIPKIKEENE